MSKKFCAKKSEFKIFFGLLRIMLGIVLLFDCLSYINIILIIIIIINDIIELCAEQSSPPLQPISPTL